MLGTQLPKNIREIIEDEKACFKKSTSIEIRNKIPNTSNIPLQNANHWLKIHDVICVFVDMRNSTGLSASAHALTTASAYTLFTSTAVKIFHEANSPYIDIKGDGVFALFDSDQYYAALAAAVSFKTFATSCFVPLVEERTKIKLGVRIGIDAKTVLVRKIGLKAVNGRSDRQNEVWAGKPVNMAAKLSSLANNNEIIISDRFHRLLKDEKSLKSCGCGNEPNITKQDLWKEFSLSEDQRFDFDIAYSLGSMWCAIHGEEYCSHLLSIKG